MNKKVSLKEIVADKIIYAVIIAVYYWMWARNDWHDYYNAIQTALAVFTVVYFCLRAQRLKKYKKESMDEMAETNLRRCDAICMKIMVIVLVVLAFVCVIARFSISTACIGYCIVGLLLIISIVRTILFTVMDTKGI